MLFMSRMPFRTTSKQILENILIGNITPTFYGLQRLLNLNMGLKNTIFPHKGKLTKRDNLSEYYFNFWKQTKFLHLLSFLEKLKTLDISLKIYS